MRGWVSGCDDERGLTMSSVVCDGAGEHPTARLASASVDDATEGVESIESVEGWTVALTVASDGSDGDSPMIRR